MPELPIGGQEAIITSVLNTVHIKKQAFWYNQCKCHVCCIFRLFSQITWPGPQPMREHTWCDSTGSICFVYREQKSVHCMNHFLDHVSMATPNGRRNHTINVLYNWPRPLSRHRRSNLGSSLTMLFHLYFIHKFNRATVCIIAAHTNRPRIHPKTFIFAAHFRYFL